MATAIGFWDFSYLIRQSAEEVCCAHTQRFGVTIEYFPREDAGIWDQRNWRGVPGICYTGDTDTCLTGRMEAPDNVLYDERGCEFIFRQPRTRTELNAVMRAGMVDPFDEYGFDGHRRWNLRLIREWWKERGRLLEWTTARNPMPDFQLEQMDAMLEFKAYLTCEAEDYLRYFGFFLENGRCANCDDRLPDLE